jgi:hypothetical protein
MKKINPRTSKWERNLLGLYRHLSFYGENYWLPLSWIILFIIIFGGIISITGFKISGLESIDYSLRGAFDGSFTDLIVSYMAIIKIFTIQGRDVVPLSVGSLLITSILPPVGLMLIALWVLAIKRRFKR